MTDYQKTIVFIAVCSVLILFTNLANTLSTKKSIEERKELEKRAYKKLTKENEELIEYILFGENQK